MDDMADSHQRGSGTSSKSQEELSDFQFKPPTPEDLQVNVQVYYQRQSVSPKFEREIYGQDQVYTSNPLVDTESPLAGDGLTRRKLGSVSPEERLSVDSVHA